MANEQKYIVYCHTNKLNGKKYIGITSQTTAERWGRHGEKYRVGIFKKAIEKYGWDNFDHEILYSGLSESDAKEKEKELIAKYETLGHKGYNLTEGGDGVGKYKFSDASRAKMSKSAKNRTDDRSKSEEYKKSRSVYCKEIGQTVYGRPSVKVKDADGNVYNSVLEASEVLNVNYYTLWNQITGRRTNKLGVVKI